MVSTGNIIAMLLSALLSVAFFIGLCAFVKIKFKASLKVGLFAAIGFFVFAATLEGIVNQIILLFLPIGTAIQSNIFTYALYGGLAAGVFEETARFIIMKFLLKKQHNNKYNAIMYGAGHGGFEVMFLIGTTMLNNLIYAIMINTNQMYSTMSALPADQQEELKAVIDSLITMKPYQFFVGYIERIPAVAIHISLSVLVWIAVTQKKTWMYPLAIVLHALVDGLMVIIADVITRSGINVMWVEVEIYISAIILCAIAVIFWKKYLATQKEEIILAEKE